MPSEGREPSRDALEEVSMVLEVLRGRGKPRARLVLADQFGVSQTLVEKWENEQQAAISYEVLELYQDFYGLPAGVILCIGQLTALACNGKKEQMENVAHFMRAIANRVLDDDEELGRDKLLDLVEAPDTDDNDRRIINALLDWTKEMPNFRKRNKSLENMPRLRRYVDAVEAGDAPEDLRRRRRLYGRDSE